MSFSNTVKASLQSYSGGSAVSFDIDPVPIPTPIPEYILQADRTLYTQDWRGVPNPGTTIYSIGGSDPSNMKFSVNVQYMLPSTYERIKYMAMSVRSPVIFCPDGLNYYLCVFDSGPLDLNLETGQNYFVGRLNFRVMKMLGALGRVSTYTFGGGGATQGNYFFTLPGQSEIEPAQETPPGPSPVVPPPPVVITNLTIASPNGNYWLMQVTDEGVFYTTSTTTNYEYSAVVADSSNFLWQIVVDNSGALGTISTASSATYTPILVSAGGFSYKISVNTSGTLIAVPQFVTDLVLKAPNGNTHWKVIITPQGHLETIITPAPEGGVSNRILQSQDGSRYTIQVSDFGDLITAQTSNAKTGPMYLVDSGLNIWQIYVQNGGILGTIKA